ncbi:MAG: GLUG motif-containing protein, partial [Fibrobacter sp.]|nr:GLUG motif-containing protein [Fibrobacter sp.]
MKSTKHLLKITAFAAIAFLFVFGSCDSHSSGNKQIRTTTSASHANTTNPADTVNPSNTTFDLDDNVCDKTLEESGTEENPLTIGSASELAAFRDAINDSTNTKTFKGQKLSNGAENLYFNLSSDIDLSSICDSNIGSWIPIGKTWEFPFKGFFDGKNYTISNLYINDSQNEYTGLFGENCGTLKNINLVNINIIAQNYAGGLVGHSFDERDGKMGTIINCTSKGHIKAKNAGGLVGKFNLTTIACCINFANVSGQISAGGIASYNEYGKITNCINTGTVSGSGSIGGIIGSNTGITSSCVNSGHVKGTCYQECDYDRAGGVVGYNEGGINWCINTGSVT